MLDVNLKNLTTKLNPTATDAVRQAGRLAIQRTHFNIEISHLLEAMMNEHDSDIPPILRQWDLAPERIASELERSMRTLKTGNAGTPTLSPDLPRWFQSAWMVASVDFQAPTVRTGHLLLTLLRDDLFKGRVVELAPSLREIDIKDFEELFERLVQNSPESVASLPTAEGGAAPAAGPPSKKEALAQFSTDLTEEAAQGKYDAIVGRDAEIRQMIDILLRRRKNNPILVGEAGVGKTAVVEGFAQRLHAGDVPDSLKNVRLHALDLTLLQAGAGVKGEFENRLKEVIKEVKSSEVPIILFIDEAHTMMGAGGAAGTGDAANLLKPALARGELRTIGATTYAEYKKHIEKDPALERRFQPVHVGEPSIDNATRMMRETADFLERHHGVRILDEAVRASVSMGDRYISGRNLPDKSVDLLDTACARVALARASEPEALEQARRDLHALEREIGVLEREEGVGDADHADALAERRDAVTTLQERIEALETRMEKSRAIVDQLLPARLLMEARVAGRDVPENTPEDLSPLSDDDLRARISELKAELKEVQGEQPLTWVCVDQDVIAEVISAWTGIPAGKMVADEIEAIQNLKDSLEQRVVGQSGALEEIVKRIQVSRAGLEDPAKPIGVFLMAGPSGVGKTETALALAETLYGGEKNLISINMSEYQESHSVSGLKGSPKGYVGYGEGGALTEPVRQRPYSVVLLDEVEKAHPDVMELFFQVFDKGLLEDTTGRMVSFRNTVIILCSNLGGDDIVKRTQANNGVVPDWEELYSIVQPRLRDHFPAAFLGRVVVLPFAPLPDSVMEMVTRLKLAKIQKRMLVEHGSELVFHDEVVKAIVSRCTEVETGARNVDNIVTNSLLPSLGRQVLGWMIEDDIPEKVEVGVSDTGEFVMQRGGGTAGAAASADIGA